MLRDTHCLCPPGSECRAVQSTEWNVCVHSLGGEGVGRAQGSGLRAVGVRVGRAWAGLRAGGLGGWGGVAGWGSEVGWVGPSQGTKLACGCSCPPPSPHGPGAHCSGRPCPLHGPPHPVLLLLALPADLGEGPGSCGLCVGLTWDCELPLTQQGVPCPASPPCATSGARWHHSEVLGDRLLD